MAEILVTGMAVVLMSPWVRHCFVSKPPPGDLRFTLGPRWLKSKIIESLTAEQLESIQKRAIYIIHHFIVGTARPILIFC